MLIVAELLAGLGLLFIGLRLVSQHLQQASGRRLRSILQRATRSPGLGMAAGALAGAATQSSNAVTLIAGNLVHVGTLRVRDAIAVVAGANAGTAALVFLAAIDFHVAVLYLVALVGLAYQLRFDGHPARRDWTGVGLGLALLFLGLDFIKRAPAGLDAAMLATWLDGGLGPVLALVLGMVVATVTQSASAATILALAALKTGVIGLDDGFWLVLGANVGSGIAVMLSGSGLTGSGRQLCLVQVLIKVVGSALVAIVWLVWGLVADQAPAVSVAALAGGDPSPWLSVLFLVLQLAGGVPATLVRDVVDRQLARLSPPAAHEEDSRPHFIYDRAVEDPPNALLLAHREHERLLQRLPALLPDLDNPQDDTTLRRARAQGHMAVAGRIEQFMVELMDRPLARQDLDEALRLQAALALLRALHDTLQRFGEVIDSFAAPRPALAFTLSESLRTLGLLLADAATQNPPDDDDLALLGTLTSDRSELLDRIRRDLAASREDGGQIRRLLLAASLFERSVWLVGRIASGLRTAPRA